MSEPTRVTTCVSHCWHEGPDERDYQRYWRVLARCCFCDAKRIQFHGPYRTYPWPTPGSAEFRDGDRDLPWDTD